ncbi:MAG: hypothetical protein ACWGPN_18240, partial [Gammaproteobacteria bacterium]
MSLSLSRKGGRCLVALLALTSATSLSAGPREQAKAIHDRLTGVPATPADLELMQGMPPYDAAMYAMEDGENSRYFYTVTLKNFAAPWTNRDHDAFVPLNDYTTLVIGMVKDDVRFDR